jgi:hypothetical protein
MSTNFLKVWVPLLVSAILVVGCVPAPSPSTGTVSGIPAGFKALSIPREDISIGAKWRPSIGPDGAGIAKENLLSVRSVDILSSNQVLSGGVKTALADFLSLGGLAGTELKMDFGNLLIDRVADLSLVNASTGDSIVYEGLKAESIKISYQSQYSAEVRAAIEQKGIPILFEGGGSGGNTMTIDGSDLYIAFRAVSLQPAGTKRSGPKNTNMTGDVKIEPYDLTIDYENYATCLINGWRNPIALPNGQGTIANFGPCQDVPVFINLADFSRSTISGDVFQKRVEVPTTGPYPYRVALGSKSDGDLITTDTLLVDRQIDHGCGDLICVPNAKGSNLELIRTSFRLVGDPSISAPGWTQ